jgi:mannan endo-1,4-beta-mannosidase
VLMGIALSAALAGCGPGFPGNAESTAGTASRPSASVGTSLPYDVSGLLDPAAGKFLGVEAGGAPDSLTPVAAFAAAIGKKPDLIGQYIAWHSPFDERAVANTWSYGALYYMVWEPYDTSVQAIAHGASDTYITRFARAVRALNLPVAISFGHEMNGDWYPWGTEQTTAADFVMAWRHIHNLFTAAGASNVIWVWNPNAIYPVPDVKLKPYYPGDSYVDWAGITGYFATTGPQTYATLYAPTIKEIKRFTRKPLIIAETSVETGAAEPACARNLVRTLTSHREVLGFIWFDYNKDGVDWRVESRPILRAAIARDVAGLQLVSLK